MVELQHKIVVKDENFVYYPANKQADVQRKGTTWCRLHQVNTHKPKRLFGKQEHNSWRPEEAQAEHLSGGSNTPTPDLHKLAMWH